jgi:hypothetical protein
MEAVLKSCAILLRDDHPHRHFNVEIFRAMGFVRLDRQVLLIRASYPPTVITVCGNNGQGTCLINFIRYWQFVSQINTNSIWPDNTHLFQINGRIHIRSWSLSHWSQNKDIKHFLWEQRKCQELTVQFNEREKLNMIK